MNKEDTDKIERMLLTSENSCDQLLRCNDFHSVKNAFFEMTKKFKEIDHPDAKMVEELYPKINESNFINARDNFIEDAIGNCDRLNGMIIEEVKNITRH